MSAATMTTAEALAALGCMLDDATVYRAGEPSSCRDCEGGLCEDHAADRELAGRYSAAVDAIAAAFGSDDDLATIAYADEAAEYAQWKFGDLEGLQVLAETHDGETIAACVGPTGHSTEKATEGWTTLTLYPITDEHPDEGDKDAARCLRIYGELRRVVVQ